MGKNYAGRKPSGVFVFAKSKAVSQGRSAFGADIFALVAEDVLVAVAENAGGLELFQHDGVLRHEDLQRIAFGDVQSAAKLNGDDDAAKLVNFAHNTG